MITEALFREIVQQATLAPSAHNTQPFVWRKHGSYIVVTADEDRFLPIADPNNHDLWVSAGCALYGLELALESEGYSIIKAQRSENSIEVEIKKNSEIKNNPLNQWVGKRYCHRDKFNKRIKFASTDLDILNSENSQLISDMACIRELAKDHDKASYFFLSNKAYFKELCDWLRLDKAEKNYHWDGLNLCSMGLDSFEQFGAKKVMRPKVFSFLKKLGVGPLLTAEATKVATSSGLWAVHVPKSYSDIESGKVFYKKWLEMTALGFSGSPLSTLVDHEKYRKKCSEMFSIPKEHKIINILKVGPADFENRPRRCRLPLDKVIGA